VLKSKTFVKNKYRNILMEADKQAQDITVYGRWERDRVGDVMKVRTRRRKDR
jgi:hypothetical protein